MVSSVASPGLIPALAANLIGFWRDYGRAAGAELEEGPDIVWFTTGVPSPAFNRAFPTQLTPETAGPALARILAASARRQVPMSWWVGPRSAPDDLRSQLEGRGAKLTGSVTGMAVDLARLPDETASIEDFRIEAIHSTAARRQWAQVVGETFDWGPVATNALAEFEVGFDMRLYADKPRYLGFLGGEPVAASALVMGGGVGGIYMVATLPPARGKGIASAMTLFPLLEARRRGAAVAVLQATAMGCSVYRRLGFEDVCRFDTYIVPPGTSDHEAG